MTWRGTRFENRLLLGTVLGLMLIVLILSVAVFAKTAVVTVAPPAIAKEYTVGASFGSKTYLEAWALYVSQSLGNVTPSSAKFVKDAVAPLLGPGVYQTAMNALEKQVNQIRENHITLFFEPRRILHEAESEKIFVHGQSVLESPSGDRSRKERTYEFVIDVMNYMPRVVHIDTYQGPPRTIDELERLRRDAEKRRSRGVSE
jgi:conjugal transfer pilus assembly protein TraE